MEAIDSLSHYGPVMRTWSAPPLEVRRPYDGVWVTLGGFQCYACQAGFTSVRSLAVHLSKNHVVKGEANADAKASSAERISMQRLTSGGGPARAYFKVSDPLPSQTLSASTRNNLGVDFIDDYVQSVREVLNAKAAALPSNLIDPSSTSACT